MVVLRCSATLTVNQGKVFNLKHIAINYSHFIAQNISLLLTKYFISFPFLNQILQVIVTPAMSRESKRFLDCYHEYEMRRLYITYLLLLLLLRCIVQFFQFQLTLTFR